MIDSDDFDFTGFEQGKRASLIERFAVIGLHGYRSISLQSEYAATILIARNGSGKTTLLGALDAFLRRQFFRLRDLTFTEIRCKFRGEQELVLAQEDLESLLTVPAEGELFKLSNQIGISTGTLHDFLVGVWPTLRGNGYPDDEVFMAIMRSTGHTYSRATALCDQLLSELTNRNPKVAEVSATIQRVLQDTEIVYLPTYRRIELALRREPEEAPRKQKPKFNVAAGSLFTGEIRFGLSDISERLTEMNNTIVRQSNAGYREISANIINELIDGSFEREPIVNSNLPTREQLKLFFSRLESRPRVFPYYTMGEIPNFEKVYSGAVPAGSVKFLNYFLSKLGTVISTTRDIERSVEDFITSCNKYLMSEEMSTVLADADFHHAGVDGKELKLNRQNLMVHVESVPGRRRIALDALSSGEKQMISLFARMFLYEKQKIVLIDEPELSLSIDWQREILVDVLNAPLCRQVVAITHSPFVFENALEPFARSLHISDAAN